MTPLTPAPARWTPGAPLRSGARVAFAGPLLSPRDALAARARAAGLVPVEQVDGETDLLVANDAACGEDGVRAAMSRGVAIVDEYAFEALLPAVVTRIPRHRAPSA